jgi:hypothetical protein
MPTTKSIKRAPSASWLDIVWKSVHQLSIVYPGRDHFHYYQDICRYIETHWERLAQGKDRTSTWTNTVSSTITTHKRIFKPGPDQGFWGLRQHPVDDTPMEILDEIRAEMGIEAPVKVAPVPDTASQQASRRKRKTGWGDGKNKKRQRILKRPVGSDSDSDEASLEFSDSISEPEASPQQQLPLLPPIFPPKLTKEEEEEFVDIEGVSEDVASSSPDRELQNWSPDDCFQFYGAPGLFSENLAVPGEEWFQSLFVQ